MIPPLCPPYLHCSCFSCSLTHSSPTIWNSLPPNIRSSTSLTRFRSLLKTHFFHLNLFYSSPIASSGFPPQRPRHLLLLVRGVTDSHLNVTEIDVNFILHLHFTFIELSSGNHTDDVLRDSVANEFLNDTLCNDH